MPCRGVRGATTADDNSSDAILKATREMLALVIRQNGIEPEDIANMAVFLASEESRMVTGHVYPVDGGYAPAL